MFNDNPFRIHQHSWYLITRSECSFLVSSFTVFPCLKDVLLQPLPHHQAILYQVYHPLMQIPLQLEVSHQVPVLPHRYYVYCLKSNNPCLKSSNPTVLYCYLKRIWNTVSCCLFLNHQRSGYLVWNSSYVLDAKWVWTFPSNNFSWSNGFWY